MEQQNHGGVSGSAPLNLIELNTRSFDLGL